MTKYKAAPGLFLIGCLLLSVSSWAAQVKDLRLWRAPDHTRVVLDLTGPVDHSVITLTNPDRIVIDVRNASLAADVSRVDLQGSPIKRVRSAVKDKSDLRVVLDVTGPVKPRSFLLKANDQADDRLVIDLLDKAASKAVIKQVESSRQRNIVVAIDAGHGGEDPGALGPGRLREKEVVLRIAKELEQLFKQEKGYQPVMVRNSDYYVGHSKRRDIARKAQADLFVSIHADAFKDVRARGASVFALSSRGATSAMADFLAKEANSSDLVGGIGIDEMDDVLGSVLLDLSMTASLDSSLKVGDKVLSALGGISHLHSRRVEQANFAVLRSPDIPSILVETGFISNPSEAKKLNTGSYQRQLAQSIFNGVKRHFNSAPPPDTYIAWLKNNRRNNTEYVIARGDTLSHIAARYQVSVADIRRHNSMSSSTIRVGQKIIIPAS